MVQTVPCDACIGTVLRYNGWKSSYSGSSEKSHDQQFCKLSASHLSRGAFSWLLNLNIIKYLAMYRVLCLGVGKVPRKVSFKNSFSQASGAMKSLRFWDSAKSMAACSGIRSFLFWIRSCFPFAHSAHSHLHHTWKVHCEVVSRQDATAAKLGPPCLHTRSGFLVLEFICFHFSFHEATLYLDIVHHAFITVVSIQEDHVQEVWPDWWKQWKHTSNRWDAARW